MSEMDTNADIRELHDNIRRDFASIERKLSLNLSQKTGLNFFQKFMIFSAIVHVASMAVVIVYLFRYGELLTELIIWPSVLLGLEGLGCCIKDGLESREKVKRGDF